MITIQQEVYRVLQEDLNWYNPHGRTLLGFSSRDKDCACSRDKTKLSLNEENLSGGPIVYSEGPNISRSYDQPHLIAFFPTNFFTSLPISSESEVRGTRHSLLSLSSWNLSVGYGTQYDFVCILIISIYALPRDHVH